MIAINNFNPKKMLSKINPFARLSVTDQENNPSFETQKTKEIKIEVGSSNIVIDGIRNICSIFTKLILLNPKINSGHVSIETINRIKKYLEDNHLWDVQVSINQYKPQMVWSRTFTNPKTSLFQN